jgi:hypothetical protein
MIMKGKKEEETKEIVVLDTGVDKDVVIAGACCSGPSFPIR